MGILENKDEGHMTSRPARAGLLPSKRMCFLLQLPPFGPVVCPDIPASWFLEEKDTFLLSEANSLGTPDVTRWTAQHQEKKAKFWPVAMLKTESRDVKEPVPGCWLDDGIC